MTNKEFAEACVSFLEKYPLLLTKKDVFNLTTTNPFGSFPILKKITTSVDADRLVNGSSRYYSNTTIKLYDEEYLITSEWYWDTANKNRPRFASWLINKAKQNGMLEAEIPKKILDGRIIKGDHANSIPETQNQNPERAEQQKNAKETYYSKIFFGAPGTGKSFKVNSILPNEDILEVPGEIRKQLFLDSDTAKKAHYAEVLDNKEKFGDIWNVDELSVLDEKLSEVNSVDNVSNPEHSALQAYIKFLKEYKYERVFRTTFHPDYDYAQFVGAYKPKKEGNAITYSFVPQVFAKSYAAAWKQYFAAGNASTAENQVYLVIEEINRGNCAQIFGDIFQLLDRDADGSSQYSIDADCDFAEWLEKEFKTANVWDTYVGAVGDGKLKLPPNLNILATMNTSDQSLFPMDSAFKRRFDWEYVPINYEKAEADFIISDTGFNFKWLDFLKKVNADIYKVTQSEDKQMGEFFIKPKNKDYITLDEFRSKVLFYLWDSVYKDELDSKLVFHFAYPEKGPDVTFQRLFNSDFVEILKKMLENLDNEYKDGAQQG